MKEYFKLLIITTVITALTIVVMDLIFTETINVYRVALASFVNGIVLGLVLKKV
jgi:hypothetical protein